MTACVVTLGRSWTSSSAPATARAAARVSGGRTRGSAAARHGVSEPVIGTTVVDRTLFGDKPLASPALGRYRTAPNSMRPRIGSGVSAANISPENCAVPYWYASADIVKISAKNPPCEPASSGTRSRAEKTGIPRTHENPRPVGASRGAVSNGVTADLGPLTDRTARPDVTRHACPPATGGVCPLPPPSPAYDGRTCEDCGAGWGENHRPGCPLWRRL